MLAKLELFALDGRGLGTIKRLIVVSFWFNKHIAILTACSFSVVLFQSIATQARCVILIVISFWVYVVIHLQKIFYYINSFV